VRAWNPTRSRLSRTIGGEQARIVSHRSIPNGGLDAIRRRAARDDQIVRSDSIECVVKSGAVKSTPSRFHYQLLIDAGCEFRNDLSVPCSLDVNAARPPVRRRDRLSDPHALSHQAVGRMRRTNIGKGRVTRLPQCK
jgi:hypothetical protein